MRHGITARALLGVAGAFLLAGASAAPSQGDLDALAATMDYRFAILDNHAADCPGKMAQCFLTTLSLKMPDTLPASLAGGQFQVHYNYVARLAQADSNVFADTLVNGDLHVLTPKPGVRFAPGKTYTVTLWGEGHFFSAYYPMPNAYLSAAGLQPRTIAAARPATDPETGIEYLPFVAPMTDEAKLANSGADDQTHWLTPARAYDLYAVRGKATAPEFAVLPTPVKATHLSGATIDLSHGVTLKLSGVRRPALQAALNYLAGAGAKAGGSGPVLTISVDAKSGIAPEGYRLRAEKGAIRIEAANAAGASYALRSLAQQAVYEKDRLRPLAIDDAPRFPFRGLHIDVARNFHSKAEILKLIDAMAAYKLNKLHLHLADDEGWRLQIKALPELTEIGSRRCGDANEMTCLLPQLGAGPDGSGPSNGYLSQADYIDIVRAAAARQIEVIPSLDMPGHSRAAIRSMEVRYRRLMAAGKTAEASRYRLVDPRDTTRYRSIQNYDDNTLNVCIDATYAFLGTALDEIAAMHRAAGAPLRKFHIGADETAGAWTGSPPCQALMAKQGIKPAKLGAYFIERVAKMIDARGLEVAGWSDGLGHTDTAAMPAHVQSNIWGGLFTGGVAEAHEQLNRGWDVVLSMPDLGYLDMPYAPDPNERGYDWATRGVNSFQIFGFMPENLPANAAFIKDITARPARIDDKVPIDQGRHIAGIQAQLWSETVRGDTAVDYMFFPRLLSLAERAWHRAGWEAAYVPGRAYGYADAHVDRAAMLASWDDFAGRMGAQWPLLDRAGIAYRLAPPGAKIVGGKLAANTEFPGLGIQYRIAGGAWRTYVQPVAVTGAIDVRAVAPNGRPGRAAALR